MKYIDLSFLEGVIQGSDRYDFESGAIVCLISILVVFSILLVIIGISSCVSKIIDLFLNKKVVTNSKNLKEDHSLEIDANDEDQMVAILVSSIDYREEIKKDVKVVSIREVK